ncbi:MAG: hypothetical protein QNJ54_04915 [Prochloraceae cyanobacterium]|nr:hypothetical protein [Prochloraceae cyanobacterium]
MKLTNKNPIPSKNSNNAEVVNQVESVAIAQAMANILSRKMQIAM